MNIENILNFLTDLSLNNNRDWFNENKKRYELARDDFVNLVDLLILKLKEIDETIDVAGAKECVFRIYRDLRFSHNKQPYKTNFGASISRGGRKSPYASYYVHIEPDSSFFGGGIYAPDKNILKAIRSEIYNDAEYYKQIINNEEFKSFFSDNFGEKLKMAPKGFPHDFPDIELLKPKHFATIHKVDNVFLTDKHLIDNIINIFKALYPFNKFLNNIVENQMLS